MPQQISDGQNFMPGNFRKLCFDFCRHMAGGFGNNLHTAFGRARQLSVFLVGGEIRAGAHILNFVYRIANVAKADVLRPVHSKNPDCLSLDTFAQARMQAIACGEIGIAPQRR